jgi:hypothetical protein
MRVESGAVLETRWHLELASWVALACQRGHLDVIIVTHRHCPMSIDLWTAAPRPPQMFASRDAKPSERLFTSVVLVNNFARHFPYTHQDTHMRWRR